MDFTSEADDEVITEAFPHKLYRPLVNPLNKVWRDSNQTKNQTSPFQIGNSQRYTNEGHNDIVELVDINTNYHDIIKYIIKFFRCNTMMQLRSSSSQVIYHILDQFQFLHRTISMNQKIPNKNKLRISCFYKWYHLLNRNSNPGMTSYITSIPNPYLDKQNLESHINIYILEGWCESLWIMHVWNIKKKATENKRE